ncbi:RNA-binding domain-containing protein [Abortiporus biennis]|nr:RNA-binding domain-containing protein [Abortiporus biennis]
MSSSQPNATLYVKNLNDKVNKDELRTQLFALFTTYGRVIDVVASKTPKMRGQAFLVFSDLAGATSAMRACEGIVFYDKPMVRHPISRILSSLEVVDHIEYAKTKSYATLKKEDPNFVVPTSIHVQDTIQRLGGALSNEKRQRDVDRMDEDERGSKREKTDDDEGEEMEIEDDEDSGAKPAKGAVPQVVHQPSARLLCTNLPQEVTDDVLSVLFQQYQGFQSTHVVPSPTPSATGQKCKMAQVLFDSPDMSTVAKEALDGFTLKKGWVMNVAYI